MREGREGGRGGMEGWREGREVGEGGRDRGEGREREGGREGGMTVIHILIGNSNPMAPQYLNEGVA